MTEKITWTNERRKLGSLIPWPRNPRKIKTDQAKRLVQSFNDFGQVEPIAIGPGNELYNGHQRLKVLAAQFGKDYEVEVRVSSRALSKKERERLTIFLHKGAAGEWDFDILSEWDIPDLMEWGFKDFELGMFQEVNNDVIANTTKAGQYDKTKMPINIGKVLIFMSPEEQEQYSENFGVYYEDGITDNPDVQETIKRTLGGLADEIRNLI
jgi:hypothetical protein